MKNFTCCFTGHRTKDLPIDIENLRFKLIKTIESLINKGVTNFIAGGAIGFDTMAALAVIDIKQKNTIKLKLYLPCKNQEMNWSDKDKITYYHILSEADEIIYISEFYFGGCMHKRNRTMVDNSSYCISYLDKESGGTFYTVDYAKSKGLQIVNLAKR